MGIRKIPFVIRRVFVLLRGPSNRGQGCEMFLRSRVATLAIATGLGLFVTSCSGRVDSGAGSNSAASPLRLSMRVAHVDKRFDTPSFTWVSGASLQNLKLTAAATPSDVAWSAVRTAQATLKLSNQSLAAAQLAAVHDTGRGAIIARFGQKIDGVPVFGTSMSVTMRRDHTPLAITGALAPSLKVLSHKGWALDERSAVGAGFAAMTGVQPSANGYAANGAN